MVKNFNVMAALPHGLEEVGAIELKDLGVQLLKISRGRVFFKADLACFYRLHLQARLPFRFLREICQFPCNGKESLYHGIQNAFDWETWLDPSKSFRVDISGISSELTHTHFTALTVKNAVVDLQRSIWGKRSNISLSSPDFCLHLHLASENATLSLDSSSTSLHRRGYRPAMGIAPLKENIASGLIKISEWDVSLNLVDPLCGSGTFLLEAVSMAKGMAPGIARKFLFENWPDFDLHIWLEEIKNAKSLLKLNMKLPKIIGFEENIEISRNAKENILFAGLDKEIEIKVGHFREFKLPSEPGIIICNPPYGKRLGNENDLESLYKEFGTYLKTNASGWSLWMLNGNPKLSSFLGMKCSKRFPISNGGIDCRWMNYKIH